MARTNYPQYTEDELRKLGYEYLGGFGYAQIGDDELPYQVWRYRNSELIIYDPNHKVICWRGHTPPIK